MAQTLKFGNGVWANKEGATLAYNDENGNYKPLPFNFTRSSSATRVNKQGLIEVVRNNKPRIDYKDSAKGALLLEPSRTNVIQYSQDFSNWTASDITVTDNNAISPDGSLNASKLTLTSGTSVKRIALGSMPTSSASRCYSFFFKTNDINSIQLLHSGDLQGYANFDLVNSVIGTSGSKTTSKIENYGNGWFRCTAIFDNTNTFGSTLYLYIKDNALGTYGGSTSEVGDLFIFGAMYEAGSYATSYIPTQGSAVTRVAEDIALTLPDNASFNSSNGFSIISKFGIGNAGSGSSSPFIFFNDDTSSTFIGFGSDSSNFRCRLNLNGVAYLNTQGNALRTQENSLFISCDADGWSQGANGVTNYTGNNDASVYDKLSNISYTPSELYGIIRIKELSVYNTRLSNNELQALTQV